MARSLRKRRWLTLPRPICHGATHFGGGQSLRPVSKQGKKIPGFSLESTGGLNFSVKVSLDLTLGSDGRPPDVPFTAFAGSWEKIACPVAIGDRSDSTPASDVSAGLETSLHHWFADTFEVLSNNERGYVYTVLHEATEAGVCSHYLTSKDRRWFCDGVANYVAWRIIEREVGKQEVLAYYDLEAELKKYRGESARIDLAAWPATEDLAKTGYAEDLNTANYAFATKVIADICARYKGGDDLLPKLFEEIGKTPREKATMETVYKAYRKLTRGDLRTYLPNPVDKK